MVLSSSSISMSEGYSELYQSSKMECFAKMQKRKPWFTFSVFEYLYQKILYYCFLRKLSCELIKNFLRNNVRVIFIYLFIYSFIYLFTYLLTLFNVDYKTLAAYALIKIDYKRWTIIGRCIYKSSLKSITQVTLH